MPLKATTSVKTNKRVYAKRKIDDQEEDRTPDLQKKKKEKLLVMFEFREQGEPDPHTIGFRRSRVPNGGVRLVRCPR